MDEITKDTLRFFGYVAIGVAISCILLGITTLVIGCVANG